MESILGQFFRQEGLAKKYLASVLPEAKRKQ
jgi:hypothetical protein